MGCLFLFLNQTSHKFCIAVAIWTARVECSVVFVCISIYIQTNATCVLHLAVQIVTAAAYSITYIDDVSWRTENDFYLHVIGCPKMHSMHTESVIMSFLHSNLSEETCKTLVHQIQNEVFKKFDVTHYLFLGILLIIWTLVM